jgi:hypothetical protein
VVTPEDRDVILRVVTDLMAEPLAEQLKMIRELRRELGELKGAVAMLCRGLERRRNFERVQAAEADDE